MSEKVVEEVKAVLVAASFRQQQQQQQHSTASTAQQQQQQQQQQQYQQNKNEGGVDNAGWKANDIGAEKAGVGASNEQMEVYTQAVFEPVEDLARKMSPPKEMGAGVGCVVAEDVQNAIFTLSNMRNMQPEQNDEQAGCGQFPVGIVVWAKVEGHEWWPGRVVRRRAVPRDIQPPILPENAMAISSMFPVVFYTPKGIPSEVEDCMSSKQGLLRTCLRATRTALQRLGASMEGYFSGDEEAEYAWLPAEKLLPMDPTDCEGTNPRFTSLDPTWQSSVQVAKQQVISQQQQRQNQSESVKKDVEGDVDSGYDSDGGWYNFLVSEHLKASPPAAAPSPSAVIRDQVGPSNGKGGRGGTGGRRRVRGKGGRRSINRGEDETNFGSSMEHPEKPYEPKATRQLNQAGSFKGEIENSVPDVISVETVLASRKPRISNQIRKENATKRQELFIQAEKLKNELKKLENPPKTNPTSATQQTTASTQIPNSIQQQPQQQQNTGGSNMVEEANLLLALKGDASNVGNAGGGGVGAGVGVVAIPPQDGNSNSLSLQGFYLEEELEDEREPCYLVKYEGRSHAHNEWVPESTLEQIAKRKLQNFKKRYGSNHPQLRPALNGQNIQQGANPNISNMNNNNINNALYQINLYKEEWAKPEKFLQRRPAQRGPGWEVLVKWKLLGFECCTWEIEDEGVMVQPQSMDLHARLWSRMRKASKILDVKGKGSVEDDVQMKEEEEIVTEIEAKKFVNEWGVELTNTQLEAAHWLTQKWNQAEPCILADDEGMGKLATTVAFIQDVRCKCEIGSGPILISTYDNCVQQWLGELEFWGGGLEVVALTGTQAGRNVQLNNELWLAQSCIDTKSKKQWLTHKVPMCDIVLITHEGLAQDLQPIKHFNWQMAVLDCRERCKSKAVVKPVRELQDQGTYTVTIVSWDITDTDNVNVSSPHAINTHAPGGQAVAAGVELGTGSKGQMEVWDWLQFMDKQARDFEGAQTYCTQELIERTGQQAASPVDEEAAQAIVIRQLQMHVMRRVKQPPVRSLQEILIPCQYRSEQREYYQTFLARQYPLLSELKQYSARQAASQRVSLLRLLLLSLHEVCTHPLLSEDEDEDDLETLADYKETSGKLAQLQKVLQLLKEKEMKSVILCNSVRAINILSYYYPDCPRIDSSLLSKNSHEIVTKFNQSNQPVILLETGCCGLGTKLLDVDIILIFESDLCYWKDVECVKSAGQLLSPGVPLVRFYTQGLVEEILALCANDVKLRQDKRQNYEFCKILSGNGVGGGFFYQTGLGGGGQGSGQWTMEHARLLEELVKWGALEVFHQDGESQSCLQDEDLNSILEGIKLFKKQAVSESDSGDRNASSFSFSFPSHEGLKVRNISFVKVEEEDSQPMEVEGERVEQQKAQDGDGVYSNIYMLMPNASEEELPTKRWNMDSTAWWEGLLRSKFDEIQKLESGSVQHNAPNQRTQLSDLTSQTNEIDDEDDDDDELGVHNTAGVDEEDNNEEDEEGDESFSEDSARINPLLLDNPEYTSHAAHVSNNTRFTHNQHISHSMHDEDGLGSMGYTQPHAPRRGSRGGRARRGGAGGRGRGRKRPRPDESDTERVDDNGRGGRPRRRRGAGAGGNQNANQTLGMHQINSMRAMPMMSHPSQISSLLPSQQDLELWRQFTEQKARLMTLFEDPRTHEGQVMQRAITKIDKIVSELGLARTQVAEHAYEAAQILLVLRTEQTPCSDFQDYTLVALVAIAAKLLKEEGMIGMEDGLASMAKKFNHQPRNLETVYNHVWETLERFATMCNKMQYYQMDPEIAQLSAVAAVGHRQSDRDKYESGLKRVVNMQISDFMHKKESLTQQITQQQQQIHQWLNPIIKIAEEHGDGLAQLIPDAPLLMGYVQRILELTQLSQQLDAAYDYKVKSIQESYHSYMEHIREISQQAIEEVNKWKEQQKEEQEREIQKLSNLIQPQLKYIEDHVKGGNVMSHQQQPTGSASNQDIQKGSGEGVSTTAAYLGQLMNNVNSVNTSQYPIQTEDLLRLVQGGKVAKNLPELLRQAQLLPQYTKPNKPSDHPASNLQLPLSAPVGHHLSRMHYPIRAENSNYNTIMSPMGLYPMSMHQQYPPFLHPSNTHPRGGTTAPAPPVNILPFKVESIMNLQQQGAPESRGSSAHSGKNPRVSQSKEDFNFNQSWLQALQQPISSAGEQSKGGSGNANGAEKGVAFGGLGASTAGMVGKKGGTPFFSQQPTCLPPVQASSAAVLRPPVQSLAQPISTGQGQGRIREHSRIPPVARSGSGPTITTGPEFTRQPSKPSSAITVPLPPQSSSSSQPPLPSPQPHFITSNAPGMENIPIMHPVTTGNVTQVSEPNNVVIIQQQQQQQRQFQDQFPQIQQKQQQQYKQQQQQQAGFSVLPSQQQLQQQQQQLPQQSQQQQQQQTIIIHQQPESVSPKVQGQEQGQGIEHVQNQVQGQGFGHDQNLGSEQPFGQGQKEEQGQGLEQGQGQRQLLQLLQQDQKQQQQQQQQHQQIQQIDECNASQKAEQSFKQWKAASHLDNMDINLKVDVSYRASLSAGLDDDTDANVVTAEQQQQIQEEELQEQQQIINKLNICTNSSEEPVQLQQQQLEAGDMTIQQQQQQQDNILQQDV